MKEIIRKIVFKNPFFWLILELLFIQTMWGINSINKFKGIEQVGVIILVVIIPVLISLFFLLLEKRYALSSKQDQEKKWDVKYANEII